MKKFLIVTAAALFGLAVSAQEQHPENCPLGGTLDCTGQCGLFTDENNDGFCDYAVLSKQKKTEESKNKSTKAEDKSVKNAQQTDKAVEKVNETKQIEQNQTNNDAETISGATETMTESVAEQTLTEEPMKAKKKFPYHLWQVLIATLGLYVVSAVSVKAKVLKKVNHRRIWNVILGLTCLVSCLIGVYVVFAKMYSLPMDYLTLMQLHVDFGISMTVIAIIHICWHANYWKNLFKNAGKKS